MKIYQVSWKIIGTKSRPSNSISEPGTFTALLLIQTDFCVGRHHHYTVGLKNTPKHFCA